MPTCRNQILLHPGTTTCLQRYFISTYSEGRRVLLKTKAIFLSIRLVDGVFIVIRKVKTRKNVFYFSYTGLLVKNWKMEIKLDVSLPGEIPAILLSFTPVNSFSHTHEVRGSESASQRLCLHKNPP